MRCIYVAPNPCTYGDTASKVTEDGAAPGVVGREHKHRWVGVGGCNENPGVWQIHATHPTRGGNGIALVRHHRCTICGMLRVSTSYQMTDGSWVRGRAKMTSQEEYEGADE